MVKRGALVARVHLGGPRPGQGAALAIAGLGPWQTAQRPSDPALSSPGPDSFVLLSQREEDLDPSCARFVKPKTDRPQPVFDQPAALIRSALAPEIFENRPVLHDRMIIADRCPVGFQNSGHWP
jgi:hypothetical protein